jgi:hypothetical protein
MNRPHDEQSKTTLLVSAIFLAMVSIASLFLLAKGPNKESVFFVLRSENIFYPVCGISAVFFAFLAYLGFKRWKAM